MKRRHLTAGQRAAVAHDALPLYEAEAAKRKLATLKQNQPASPDGADLPHRDDSDERPKNRAPRSRDKAGKATGASGRATAQFKRVAEQAPDLAAKVKAGAMALDRAERIIRDRDARRRGRVTTAVTTSQRGQPVSGRYPP